MVKTRKPGDFFKSTLDVIAMIFVSLIIFFVIGWLLVTYPIFTIVILIISGIIYLVIKWRNR